MIDIDLSEEIRALRSTFADIRSVVGVERLEAEIADLNEQAGVADLWDDTANAQHVLRGGGPADYFSIGPEQLFKLHRPSN
jgi:hypothetical protein